MDETCSVAHILKFDFKLSSAFYIMYLAIFILEILKFMYG